MPEFDSLIMILLAGIDLMQVVTHELGHSLGLLHSEVTSSVMGPTYNGYNPNFRLTEDDIKGIQALYGKSNCVIYTCAFHNYIGACV